ncbi:MAG: hypothetical protein IPF92_10205 [Myxococcales bacterium]|nr:hypothetical protein [Myxococcales bacterium]MBL0192883.1 hypothetical protein [Myxococcales bacterium]HQY60285.1 hypothetical protein [Polyangiaceae bacterium]
MPLHAATARQLASTELSPLESAWDTRGYAAQLRAVLSAGEAIGERFASGPRVIAVRTLPLTTLPYPTRYALGGSAFSPAPFVTLTHRCVLVQFLEHGAPKTLLFNPTDAEASRATPFFARLAAEAGPRLSAWMARSFEPLEAQLSKLGLAATDIDYVAFDHFHTQDLRSLLGTRDGARAPRFPNATLLAPAAEWQGWDDLHPLQRAWFVADGKRGVREERVTLTTSDLALGDGVMLLRTPGHTVGNQTLFVNTDGGVWGISENGTCADNWSPVESRIAGLSATARAQGLDVLPNSNTPERLAQQYTSMLLERAVASRVKRAPAFAQMFPSSELTPGLAAPGLHPTLVHTALSFGALVRPARQVA